LAIFRGSFPLLARALLPLALLFILAGCGGASKPEPVSTRLVRGPGFSFSAPGGSSTSRTQRTTSAVSGKTRVSVTTYTLLKAYRPARFAAAAKELDRIAAKLASEAGATVTERQTLEVAGEKVRAYRFDATRIGFVLVGRREYQLLCRLPAGGADTEGACALLFETFALT
jgi:hypothetical protein